MYRKYHIHLLLVFLALFARATGQQFNTDMALAKKAMTGHLSYQSHYRLYSTHALGSKPIQEYESTTYLWDKLQAFKTENLNLITNEKLSIAVDHLQRVILINPAPKKQQGLNEQLQAWQKLIDDSTRRNLIRDSILFENGDSRVWRVWLTQAISGVAYMDVAISLPTYQISRLVYYYDRSFEDMFGDAPDGIDETSKPCVEINLTGYQQLIEADKQKYFSESAYVKMDEKGNAKALPIYKTYTLSNYYNIKP